MKTDLKDLLDEFPIDRVIAGDEWDHFHDLISGELEVCEFEDHEFPLRLPFFRYFKDTIKDKLIEAGFKKEIIEDKKDFGSLIYILNFEQGRPFKCQSWDLDPPFGFPQGTYKVSEDKHTMWINSDIDAALRVLESIRIMKELLINNGVVNKEAVKVYLRTLELTINLTRAGNTPKLAIAENDKQKNRKKTMLLYGQILYAFLKIILEQAPSSKKWTLGYVMLKWNVLLKNVPLRDTETEAKYKTEKLKNSKGEEGVLISGLNNNLTYFFKKRSLQRFIDVYKKNNSKITL